MNKQPKYMINPPTWADIRTCGWQSYTDMRLDVEAAKAAAPTGYRVHCAVSHFHGGDRVELFRLRADGTFDQWVGRECKSCQWWDDASDDYAVVASDDWLTPSEANAVAGAAACAAWHSACDAVGMPAYRGRAWLAAHGSPHGPMPSNLSRYAGRVPYGILANLALADARVEKTQREREYR